MPSLSSRLPSIILTGLLLSTALQAGDEALTMEELPLSETATTEVDAMQRLPLMKDLTFETLCTLAGKAGYHGVAKRRIINAGIKQLGLTELTKDQLALASRTIAPSGSSVAAGFVKTHLGRVVGLDFETVVALARVARSHCTEAQTVLAEGMRLLEPGGLELTKTQLLNASDAMSRYGVSVAANFVKKHLSRVQGLDFDGLVELAGKAGGFPPEVSLVLRAGLVLLGDVRITSTQMVEAIVAIDTYGGTTSTNFVIQNLKRVTDLTPETLSTIASKAGAYESDRIRILSKGAEAKSWKVERTAFAPERLTLMSAAQDLEREAVLRDIEGETGKAAILRQAASYARENNIGLAKDFLQKQGIGGERIEQATNHTRWRFGEWKKRLVKAFKK